jgi:hypothetical protein
VPPSTRRGTTTGTDTLCGMTTNTVGTTGPPDASQRRAARVVGLLYLLLMASGVFAQIYVPGSLPGTATVPDDAAGSVAAIADSEGLLRLGVAVETLTFAGDVVLAVAYLILLRPISRGLALLGAFWRLAQVAILTSYNVTNIVVLQLLSATQDGRAFTAEQVSMLAWVATSSHAIGYAIGFVFLGLGSAVFSYLLFRSKYIPRLFGAFGMFAFPDATPIVNPALFVPMFLFEVGTGLWLLIRGVR